MLICGNEICVSPNNNTIYINSRKDKKRSKRIGFDTFAWKNALKYIIFVEKVYLKFGDYNIGREGQLLTLPSYIQFLLNLQPEEIVLEPVDIDEINRMASEFLGKKEVKWAEWV